MKGQHRYENRNGGSISFTGILYVLSGLLAQVFLYYVIFGFYFDGSGNIKVMFCKFTKEEL